jgi:hypothetical protein
VKQRSASPAVQTNNLERRFSKLTTKKKYPTDFPIIGSSLLEQALDIRKTQRQKLQKQLASPIYWYQFPGGRKVFWNLNLVRDYLLNGNTDGHQALVEQYLQSLPKVE